MRLFSILLGCLYVCSCLSQDNYGNNWILGYGSISPGINGSQLNFNTYPATIYPLDKPIKIEGANTSVSDKNGALQFYSNGCKIVNYNHEIILNGDSIGLGLLQSSFCESGGNPLIQGIIGFPMPNVDSMYYLVYTDIQTPYEFPTGLYFPLAPTSLYYSIIDMRRNNGKGEVTEKNILILSDTLSRGSLQVCRHINGTDWWLIVPESHSNCYYTILLTQQGADTIYKQCIGEVWDDLDSRASVVFSPDLSKYVRFNYYHGLNVFDFDNNSGILSNALNINFGQDTFLYAGVVISPNSRFLYALAFDKIFQFDLNSGDVENTKVLIGLLNTPDSVGFKTRFHQGVLGRDGYIYIGGTNTHNHLHVIRNPDCLGLECNLQQYAINLHAFNLFGMPNLPQYIKWQTGDLCDTTSVFNQDITNSIIVWPNPFSSRLYFNCKMAPIHFQFYDIVGNRILDRIISYGNSSIETDLVAPGQYFYTMTYNGRLISSRIFSKI